MNYRLDTLRGDLFGGITSAVVGLPVALAFGVVSGLGALAGLYGAIAVGFFAAVFGGTKSQISGPTGPQAVAIAVIVTSYANNLAEALTVVFLSGLIQILLGVVRLGRFVAYTPHVVVSGFMSGIGLIVILLQIPPFFGLPIAEGGPIGAIQSVPTVISGLDPAALLIASVTLAVGVFWPKKLRKVLPPTLAALAIGTLMGVLWLKGTPVIGHIPTGLPQLHLPPFSLDLLVRMLQPAVTLALLGSIDSLLTSLVADSMTRTRHNADRELVGQGIGNVATSLIGGMSGAGATPGTVVNLRAGGTTRVSGVIRAAVLTAIAMGLGGYVEAIPHAVLAGILLKVGWDIIDWRFLTRIRQLQRDQVVVVILTLVMTVFLDLVTAVVLGLIVAGMVAARNFERLELDSVISVPILDRAFLDPSSAIDDFTARVGLVALRGTFTVASASKLITTISVDIQDHEVVILDFSETTYIDASAALVVEQMIESAADDDTAVVVQGLSGEPADFIDSLNILRTIPPERIVDTVEEAREQVKRILEPQDA